MDLGSVQTAGLSQHRKPCNRLGTHTCDVLERARQAMILDSAPARKPRSNGNSQNCPPQNSLIADIVSKTPEEQQEGELDGPKTGIEEGDDGNLPL